VKKFAGSNWWILVTVVIAIDLAFIGVTLSTITTLFSQKFWYQFFYRTFALAIAFMASNRYIYWRFSIDK